MLLEEAKAQHPKVQSVQHRLIQSFAILPYNSSESDTALPYEQATSIAEGLVGKKYSAYDLGSIGGLKEGGLQEAIDAYKTGNSGLGSLATLGDAIGLGDRLGT